jgi:acetyl-CoA acetyltransferase
MRPDTTAEKLAALKPAFRKGGVVTAGNASGIGDGAAALVVTSEQFARSHEAFAAQTCAVERELALPRERLNVHGGAIALSHPLAASGARITAHLLHALRAQGKRYGLGTACIGGGQGIAVVVESIQ